MYYVYILESIEGELYFGSTNDLKRRLKEHQTGKVFSTKKTKWNLIYYEAYAAEVDARAREHRIKHFGQAAAQLKKRIANSRQHKS